jgi:hypothetical protein
MLWEYQRAIGMPRVAAIEHPFGRPYGEVDDERTQSAVLLAALQVFELAIQPGHVEHLGFVWHEDPTRTLWHPPRPAPIVAHMKARGLL